jgi:type II secretory pathway pseudopilin PulG
MDSTAIPWMMLASVVMAAFSAIAAAISAYLSSRSSRTAANVAATNLILKFRDQYATDAMLIDLRNLRAWHDRHGSSKFAKTWQEKLEQKDEEALERIPLILKRSLHGGKS